MHTLTARLLTLVAAVVLFAASSGTAYAGPPLICHPFDAGSAALLPWGPGPGWNSPDRAYDVQKLTADTLRLLTPTAPVLARMENIRRATIYAGHDRKVAAALLKAIVGRVKTAGHASNDPMIWFDAGYVIETYRQNEGSARWNMLADSEPMLTEFLKAQSAPRNAEGYALVQKALQLAGQNPEMEFAASLMTRSNVAAEHRRRAVAGAPKGSLLAKNLGNIPQ